MNSDDLLASVKRKISFPSSQNTFTDADILAFANEELMISQVPSILQFHEEYFVAKQVSPIISNQSAYAVPTRAIGMKLRQVAWCDNVNGPDYPYNGNLFEMTRIDAEDKPFFQSSVGADRAVHKYYIEGNNINLIPSIVTNPTGSIVMYYFQRPNMLTTTDQAATIQNFSIAVTVGTVVAGDTLTITNQNSTATVFTAVVSGATGNQFNIGGTPTITATNLAAAIQANGVATATSANAVVTIVFGYVAFTFVASSANLTVDTKTGFIVNQVPSTFVANSICDMLQTKPGHQTRAISITLKSIAGMTIFFNTTDVPSTLVTGDYVCLENQCIIPQIPPDLHNGLAERTAARILAALGDMQGLQASGQKIQEIEKNQGMLLDNRTEGEPRKILARHSLLRYGKMGTSRRL